MSEQLRSTVGVFSSAGGRWYMDKAVNIRAVEPAADLPAAQRGSLYVFIELSGGRTGDRLLHRQMLDEAQSAFYGKGDTVDAAIRQAVRSVHTLLVHANEADPTVRLRAGMTLVMRYANRLVVAQAGPALAVLSHPDGVDQFPRKLANFTPALGGVERPEPIFFDTTIEPGSMFILAHSTWPQVAPPQTLAATAASGASVAHASQYLGQVAGDAELSALLVSFHWAIPSVQPEPAQGPTSRPVAPPPPPAEEAPAEGERPRGGLFGGRKLFGLGRGAEEESTLPAEPAAETWSVPPASVPGRPASAVPVPQDRSTEHPARETSQLRTPPADAAWTSSTPRDTRPRTTPPAAQPVYDEPAPSVATAESSIETPPRRSAWPLVLALVVLPLLIIGVVVGMLLVRTRAAEAQFAEKITGAANVITQAEALDDETAASEKLVEARDFLDQARTLRPNDVRLGDQQTRFEAVLNRVEHITPLYGILPLWDFKSEGRNLTRVIAGGDSLFVLDRGRNEVQRFIRSTRGDSVQPANEAAKPLFARGEAIDDKTVGDLLDVAWAPAATSNQRSLLLTLDINRNLIGFDTGLGVKMLGVGGTAKWVQPTLLGGYGGNLYVADTGGNQIWRYRPQGNGYEGEPETYFANPNALAGLKAMAIDGNIWLLFADGRLLKFLSGEQPQFAVTGLRNNFSNPVALAVPQEGNRLYVADPANSRIVELTKDGQFIRQFKAREGDILKNMTDLFLDEAGRLFYILTPDQLFTAIVPDETQPAATEPTS